MAVGIQLKGDWRKLKPQAKRLGKLPKKYEQEVMPQLAELVKVSLQHVILSSPPPPNAESTVRKKGKNDPLNDSGQFDDNIVIKRFKQGIRRSTVYLVKGSRNRAVRYYAETGKKRRPGLTYEELLPLLSEGNANIPGRDMISIAYDMCESDIKYFAVNDARRLFREG